MRRDDFDVIDPHHRARFGITLGKIFLFDLAELSSVARAASFVGVGAMLLAGGFFVQRLGQRDRARPS